MGDFLLQDRETALNKSKSFKYLGQHLFAIFCCIAATGLGLGMPAVYLAGCYIVVHGIQDWYIWNGYKYLVMRRILNKVKTIPNLTQVAKETYIQQKSIVFEMEKEYAEDKVFYDTIGLDRLLHVITIVILYGVFFL